MDVLTGALAQLLGYSVAHLPHQHHTNNSGTRHPLFQVATTPIRRPEDRPGFIGPKTNGEPGLPLCSLSRTGAIIFLRECLTSQQMRIQIYRSDQPSSKSSSSWSLAVQASPGNLKPLADLQTIASHHKILFSAIVLRHPSLPIHPGHVRETAGRNLQTADQHSSILTRPAQDDQSNPDLLNNSTSPSKPPSLEAIRPKQIKKSAADSSFHPTIANRQEFGSPLTNTLNQNSMGQENYLSTHAQPSQIPPKVTWLDENNAKRPFLKSSRRPSRPNAARGFTVGTSTLSVPASSRRVSVPSCSRSPVVSRKTCPRRLVGDALGHRAHTSMNYPVSAGRFSRCWMAARNQPAEEAGNTTTRHNTGINSSPPEVWMCLAVTAIIVAIPGIVPADGFALHGCYTLNSAGSIVGSAMTVYPFFYKLDSQYIQAHDGAGTMFMCYADQNVGNRLLVLLVQEHAP
ncbi:hypothetical protein PGTUg99_035360 [Puccinia graminis f. sp. tritici]|uniref:Uncharacterized protein n=1 Tax=Puccinia graminis f. sp. tritici TaxID=56615 RepID=A0A5B0RQJ6_PUCGR|nr:hypothetical protein PGTUg99_035360 [Puccinia graminis f. sp. tritici]